MSAISLDGVEENINSRFVDYSCSTDWEIFINDIYNKSKDLIINNDPETYPVVINFRKVDFNLLYDINVSNSLFNKWFNFSSNYISLSYLDEWRINSNPSSKRTIFSALILGIQLNENTKYLPIFFIPTSKKRIELCYEIIGYQIILFPDSMRRLISHYESTLHDIADNPKGIKDNLMYLDGLYNLFTKKLSMYSSMKYNDKNIDIKVIEYYSYTSEKLRYHYSILRNTESLPITADNLLFQTFEKVNQYLQPALSNYNNTLNGQNSRKHFQNVHIVNLLRVELTYIGSRDKYIIDNENYTLLNPFDQMSENWTIYSSFDDTEIPLLSNILNNFMSNYVISNCIIMKDNMNKNPSLLNLCNHIKSNYCVLDITKLYSFTQFLHSDLYRTVTHLTNVITDYTSDKSNDVTDNSKNKQFLQYLFNIKELMNVETYTNNDINNCIRNIFNLYFNNYISDYSDLLISNPIGWIDLLGLFIGQSNTGLLDLSDIWQEIVVKLRDSYDSDIIYSHLDRYIEPDNPKKIKTIDSLQNVYKLPDTSLCYTNLLCKESNYLPDFASPLIIQKLQLLQYYINMKYKSMQIEYTKIESYESEIESKHEDINVINNIQNAMLYHRLPLTSDLINQQEKIISRHTENYFNGNYTVKEDEKIFSNLDSKINERISPIIDSTDLTNLLFHYQIYLPTLLADMKAFRLSNPSAALLDFCLWYNINEPIEQRIIDLLVDLWVIIEKSNYQSKPLYRNNTEIEKIFNYFDNITTHIVYSNFMIVCLPTIYLLISTNVYMIIVSIFSNISKSNKSPLVNICIELLNDLMNLKQSMNRYISQLNDNLSNNINSNISYDQINNFNIIYEKIKYFETFYIKYKNLVDIITFYCIKLSAIYNYSNNISDSQPSISYNQIDIQSISLHLTLYNEYTAQNPSETLVLYYLAIGTTKSNNHNISNRLLIPKKKTLIMMKAIEIINESNDNIHEFITDKPINHIRIDINEENFRVSSKIHEFD